MAKRAARSGTAALEHWLVVGGVALAGLVGMAFLGSGFKQAISGDGRAAFPAALVTSSQAGSADLAARAAARAVVHAVEPMADLADEVRLVRTSKWAGSRYAFGDKGNEIQFALEYEGVGDDIVGAYHPLSVDFRDWEGMESEEQIDWLYDNLKLVGRGERRAFNWEQFIRRMDAPDTLVDRLTSDLGRWEVKTHGYVRELDRLFEDATFLDREVGGAGFHWHVSFRHDAQHDPTLLAYWQHAEEYLRIRALTEDAGNVDSRFLTPLSETSVRDAGLALAATPEAPLLSTLFKFHTVGLRAGMYGKAEPNRMGLELRAANYDLGEAARMVESTVRLLENPKTAKVRFNAGVTPYAVRDLVAVDHYAEHPIPEDVAKHLSKGSKGSAREREEVLWHMPYVRWEDRPFLAADAAVFATARAHFERGVRALAGDRKSSLAGSAKRSDLAKLLQAWAKETNLGKRY